MGQYRYNYSLERSREFHFLSFCAELLSHLKSFFFNFYFYFILLYNTVLVLPYIYMNPPFTLINFSSLADIRQVGFCLFFAHRDFFKKQTAVQRHKIIHFLLPFFTDSANRGVERNLNLSDVALCCLQDINKIHYKIKSCNQVLFISIT